MLSNATHSTIQRSLSENKFMRFEFSKSAIKDKYGKEGLLRFTECMYKIVIEDSHLNYDEFLNIGELLARSSKQHDATY